MKALISIMEGSVRDDLDAAWGRWIESCGYYYDSPAGAGLVIPALVVPGVADDELRHPLGLQSTPWWSVWTRSSGTVVAVTRDRSGLLVAGTRHSVAEVLGDFRIPGMWLYGSARPSGCWAGVGTWFSIGEAIARADWLVSRCPEYDPLRPVVDGGAA